MNHKFHLVAGLVCALTATSAVASAQTQPWLADRKYTEGIGYRVGDFEFHPGAAAEFGYDSNFYHRAPEESPIGSLRLRITPSLSLSTLSPQRREGAPSASAKPDFDFRASLSGTYNEFFPISGGSDESDRSQMSKDRNMSGDLDLRLGIMPGRTWSGVIGAGVTRALNPSNAGLNADSSDLPADGFKRILPRAHAELAYTPGGGLLDWRLGYTFSGTFFESSRFNQLTNFVNEVETRGRWRFLPRTALIFDARFGFIKYPSPVHKLDSHPMRAMLGVSGLITSSFSLQAMVGWGASFYTPKPQEDFNSVIGRVEAKWFLTPNPSTDPGAATLSLSNISVGFSRDFFDAYIGTYAERDRGYASLSYFFDGRFLLVVDGGAGPVIYPSISYLNLNSWADVRIDASAFGEYRFKDSFGINANVRYNQNLSGTSVSVAGSNTDFFKWNEIEAYLGFRWFM